jgi:signal transduction histidine kinase
MGSTMEVSTTKTQVTLRGSLLLHTDFLRSKGTARMCSQSALCTREPCPRGGQAVDNGLEPKVKLRILMVEDSAADIELILRTLKAEGFNVDVDVVQTPEEFILHTRATDYDVILADYNLPAWRGTEALDIICRENIDVPLIVVTGYLGEEKAVDCIKQGASDYVSKDHLARLPGCICRALDEKGLRLRQWQSEEELAKKVVELARSNAELEQFAYVASHDLQEPLRMIANYTQLLAESYQGKLDPQADKYIAYAVDGALRMQALIRDLLKFSRAGTAEIVRQSTRCYQAVEQALNNLQVAIKESGAVVNWDGLPTVMADAAQLTQVFQNLIANAIKFRGAERPLIQIYAEKKDGDWVLTVSDNGIGIPADHWQQIFVVFRRLHTREEYAGNGIGLSICKKIVERHGGRIWIEAQQRPVVASNSLCQPKRLQTPWKPTHENY